MPISFLAVKHGGAFFACNDEDKNEAAKIKHGEVYRWILKKRTHRSTQHNKLYWSGLLELASQYWTPTSGCLSPAEEKLLEGFAIYLNKLTDGSGKQGLEQARIAYQEAIKKKRAAHYELPAKDKDDIHMWIKEELGYYNLILTPAGWRKELKSTNFETMGQERFNKFYKDAFDVVWNFILSQHFESEEQAQNVINELLSMGG